MKASGWHRANRNTPAAKARQKKYNSAEHKAARVEFGRLVAAGAATCWRCGRHIPPGSEWHVGHDDSGTRIMGPEHGPCNVQAAARKGQRLAGRSGRPRPTMNPRHYPLGF